jgi:hypothetical protein
MVTHLALDQGFRVRVLARQPMRSQVERVNAPSQDWATAKAAMASHVQARGAIV